MISYGLRKPLTIWAQPNTSHSNAVYTASWRALQVPNTRAGERARWVCLTLGHPYDPTVPCHVYVQPNASSSSPSAGEEDYCPILHGFQSSIVIDVAGCSHVHVRAVNVNDVEVHLAAIESDSLGVLAPPLHSPPQIAADSNSVVLPDSSGVTVARPFNAAGNRSRHVLIAWDDDSTFVYLHGGNIGSAVVLHPIADNPSVLNVSNLHYGTSMALYKVGTGPDVRFRVTPLEDY